MTTIRTLWHNHTALLFYLALMAVLLLGIQLEAGSAYQPVNLHYLWMMLAAYGAAWVGLRPHFNRLAEWSHLHGRWAAYEKPLALVLDAVVLFFPFAYFASAGYVPFVRMMYMDDYYAASGLRQAFRYSAHLGELWRRIFSAWVSARVAGLLLHQQAPGVFPFVVHHQFSGTGHHHQG